MLARARAHVPAGVTVRLRSPQSASPARGLTELAEREGADLVVVGSSRRGAAGRINLERTAGRLLQGGPCAVSVAPADAQTTGPFRHVGIACGSTSQADSACPADGRAAFGATAVAGTWQADDGGGGDCAPPTLVYSRPMNGSARVESPPRLRRLPCG
jgi:hypothetical protein